MIIQDFIYGCWNGFPPCVLSSLEFLGLVCCCAGLTPNSILHGFVREPYKTCLSISRIHAENVGSVQRWSLIGLLHKQEFWYRDCVVGRSWGYRFDCGLLPIGWYHFRSLSRFCGRGNGVESRKGNDWLGITSKGLWYAGCLLSPGAILLEEELGAWLLDVND